MHMWCRKLSYFRKFEHTSTKWQKLSCQRRIASIITFVNTIFLHWHAEFSEVLIILPIHTINILTLTCESYVIHKYARVLHANIFDVGFLHNLACFTWKLKKISFHAFVKNKTKILSHIIKICFLYLAFYIFLILFYK